MNEFQSSILLISPRSPFARRVRIAFQEHGVPYEERVLNVFEPTPELLEANPFGRVPVLKLSSGVCVVDSNAILSLFYQSVPESPWIARQPEDRVRAARGTGFALALCELAVAFFLESLREHPDQAMRSETERDFAGTLAQLEQGLYVSGQVTEGGMTQADIDLAVALTYLDLRWGTGWKKAYPRLADFQQKMEKRPSFAATVPPPA